MILLTWYNLLLAATLVFWVLWARYCLRLECWNRAYRVRLAERRERAEADLAWQWRHEAIVRHAVTSAGAVLLEGGIVSVTR